MPHTPRPLTRQGRSAVCILAGCLALLLVPTAPSAAQGSQPPLVVFGDSLSDSGNAFAFVHANATPPDFGLNELLVPTVAPYAIGGHHFTNGDTWVEQLASALHIGRFTKPAFASASPNAMNFAIATARARQIPPQSADDEIVPSLAFEIGVYLQKSGGVASPETLYVIEVGSNDVRDALEAAFAQPPDPNGAALILQQAGLAIANGITTLYAAGARHFLVWNVPTQALAPATRILNQTLPGFQAAAALATGLFNTTLSHEPAPPDDLNVGLLQVLRATLPGSTIRLFDADATLALFFFNPAFFGFTNVTDACVTPGVAPFTCRRPDRYLFWDGIHPTAAAHGRIAREVARLFGY